MSGMLACVMGWVLLFGAVSEEEAWREPAAATASLGDAVVHVPMDHAHRLVEVPVRIDGRGPFLFALDTSCERALVLEPSLAEELGLLAPAGEGEPPAPAREADDADRDAPPLARGRVGRVEAGEAGFLDVNAEVRPLRADLRAPVRGVLGMPLFENLLLTIDYARSELVLSRGALARDAADVFPLLGPGHAPHVPLQVGGHVWPARIDTGDPDSLTFPGAAADDVRTQRAPVPVVATGETTRRVRAARLDEPLLVAGRGYQQLPVLFADDADEARLGYGMLAHYVLTFDQRQGLVRFGFSAPAEQVVRERSVPTAGSSPARAGAWTHAADVVGSLLR